MDKVRGGVTHVDLHEVRLDQPITASVSVHLIGGENAPGVKEGGVLSQPLREIQVEALPLEVPEHIDLDVSHMATGDTLRIGDIEVREGVTFLDDPGHRRRDAHRADARHRGRRGRGAEARGRRGRGRRGRGASRARPPRAKPSRRRTPPATRARPRAKPRCGCGPAVRGRRSTCSSSVSATRAANTRATATTSATSCVDELARRHDGSWKSKFSGQIAEIRLDGHKVALLKPETYMNESGVAVSGATRFYKLEPGEVLVVHDEGDFDLGRLELKVGGGLSGHNGLRSIAQHLKTPDFLRLRVGVGRPERGDPRPLADYVLSNFEPHDDAESSRRARRRRGRAARRRRRRAGAARRQPALDSTSVTRARGCRHLAAAICRVM